MNMPLEDSEKPKDSLRGKAAHSPAKAPRGPGAVAKPPNADLEGDLYAATNIAYIAVSLLEDNLGNRSNVHNLSAEDIEGMAYAVHRTYDQIREIRDRYLVELYPNPAR